MIDALSSSTISGIFGAGQSTAGLDAQLAQYQTKLADWQNCPACKTPEGKAKIAEYSNKIGEIKQRMQAAEAATQRDRSEAGANASLAPGGDQVNVAAAPQSSQPVGALGNRLDVYA